jgi:hypothetical protein
MSSWAKGGAGGGKGGGPGILHKIPGYSGYRAKESRRDEDKQVRLELARGYDLIAQRLGDLQGELVRNQRFAEIGNVERLERSLRLFTDRLRTATYGYGGLFSDRPIDERALDQIAAFDRALGDDADELSASVEAIAAAALSGEGLPQKVRDTQALIDGLNRRFDLRSEAVNSGQPVSGAGVPDVFAPQTQEQANVADDLHFGDAVSISGADYLVKGRMEFHAGEDAWRQYLLRDTDEERWLHVPPSTAEPMALLAASAEAAPEGEGATVGGKAYTQAASGTATAEVVGESGRQEGVSVKFRRYTGDAGSLLFAYDWGGRQQVLAGRTLDPLEIKVYSA